MADQVEEQRAEELFRILTELFDHLPDERPVHLKVEAGKLWLRRRPNGLSVVHTMAGGATSQRKAA